MKTIGVLTSGGDAPGMNAAIRAVVRTACENGIKVFGINEGYKGLIEGNLQELNIRSVSDIIHRGGTMLHSARCREFQEEAGMQKALETCGNKEYGIEGIVVIGGDGSFRGARDLSLRGIPCIGIPGTIDNDIVSSDYTIGYDTCLNTVMQMVDRVRDTVESHSRCIVVEVMGNKCGDLTLNAGIAVGATAIVIPEIQSDIEKHVIERIKRTQTTDKKHFIVMVAEGIGGVEELARKIEKECKVESRAVILGHVQRGGSPTVRDRVVASQMGYKAVQLLMQGIGNRVVVQKDDHIIDYDIYEALSMDRKVNSELYKIAHEISI
ncbi:MAG: 6-phosphofructokinase [Clostridia bacterium]|nr:6-phosphofructokinase [Clostridia bacterium]